MLYYRVPVVAGKVDCSAGSILCCAYPKGDYMVCKFESVANVGENWVEITAEEFEYDCPEFPPFFTDDDYGKILVIGENGGVVKQKGTPSMVGIVASDVDITAGSAVVGSWDYYDVYK